MEQGWKDARALIGGFDAWKEGGGEVEDKVVTTPTV